MILHTEVIGDGEPIVFLHTGLQTGMTDFEYQREHFKDKFNGFPKEVSHPQGM